MTYIKRNIICLVLCLCASYTLHSKSIVISTSEEFQNLQSTLGRGDSIIWKEGIFKDVNLILEANNIIFQAAKSGATTFEGSSTLAVTGNGNVISGFQFIGGKIEGDVVDISGSNNTIQHINIASYDSHYYLRVRPNCQYNKIYYCNFEGKPETQESSVVQIEASETMIGYHILSYCSFKNHTAPEGVGGDFGIEALRIGYSYQRMFTSRTLVEYCYFEKCNGDYEIISCKARENLMRYNTFNNNGPAHLTLRHGSLNMVYGNFFLNGAGVRIKEGQNHAIVNNYFDTGDRFSVNIQNHHFDPVDTVIIAHNTFISQGDLILGGKGDYPPKYTLLANNLFSAKIDTLFSQETLSEIWRSNVLQQGKSSDNLETLKLELRQNSNGFFEPKFDSGLSKSKSYRISEIYDIPSLDDDFKIEQSIMKQPRGSSSENFPGCFQADGKKPLLPFVNENNTGPDYLLKN